MKPAVFAPDQYELLDFGAGRKLERFGPHVLDRPCPVAESVGKTNDAAWALADARYERLSPEQGMWLPAHALPESWSIEHAEVRLELKPAGLGQVGIFPEQAANWDWIREQLLRRSSPAVKLLNLFAYTGGSTLVAAAAGAEVVHVDASSAAVARARRNAQLSGLSDKPIRWIVEDAMKFVGREVRRGRRYEGVILDPPSYGHGPGGEVWKLEEHLPALLELCASLISGSLQLLVVTCHVTGLEPADLLTLVKQNWQGIDPNSLSCGSLTIADSAGRELPSGIVVRVAG